jgi:hypothetical protein
MQTERIILGLLDSGVAFMILLELADPKKLERSKSVKLFNTHTSADGGVRSSCVSSSSKKVYTVTLGPVVGRRVKGYSCDCHSAKRSGGACKHVLALSRESLKRASREFKVMKQLSDN